MDDVRDSLELDAVAQRRMEWDIVIIVTAIDVDKLRRSLVASVPG